LYTSIYIYRVPNKNIDAFLQVQKEASEIYQKYGAIEDVTFAAFDVEAKYGCLGFLDILETRNDETMFVGLSRFENRVHHDEVMAKVDQDSQINILYEKVTSLIEINRVVRGEFAFAV